LFAAMSHPKTANIAFKIFNAVRIEKRLVRLVFARDLFCYKAFGKNFPLLGGTGRVSLEKSMKYFR